MFGSFRKSKLSTALVALSLVASSSGAFAANQGGGHTGGGEIARFSDSNPQGFLGWMGIDSLDSAINDSPLGPLDVTLGFALTAPIYWADRAGARKLVRNLIERDLKTQLIAMVRGWNADQIRAITYHLTPTFAPIRKVLLERRQDFIDDIERTPYEMSPDLIVVDGVEKDAATEHRLAAKVRFNVKRIGSYRATRDELKQYMLALAFHEHVRHFGFPDDTYELAKMAVIGLNNDFIVTARAGLGARMSQRLSVLVLARTLQPYTQEKLLCKTSLGEEPCRGIDKLRLKYILGDRVIEKHRSMFFKKNGELETYYLFGLGNEYQRRAFEDSYFGSNYTNTALYRTFVDAWADTPGARSITFEVLAAWLANTEHTLNRAFVGK